MKFRAAVAFFVSTGLGLYISSAVFAVPCTGYAEDCETWGEESSESYCCLSNNGYEQYYSDPENAAPKTHVNDGRGCGIRYEKDYLGECEVFNNTACGNSRGDQSCS